MSSVDDGLFYRFVANFVAPAYVLERESLLTGVLRPLAAIHVVHRVVQLDCPLIGALELQLFYFCPVFHVCEVHVQDKREVDWFLLLFYLFGGGGVHGLNLLSTVVLEGAPRPTVLVIPHQEIATLSRLKSVGVDSKDISVR